MRFEIYFAGRTTRRGLHLSGRSWSWPRERKRRLKEGRRREMERRERRRMRRRRLLRSGWSRIFSALLAPLGEPRFRYMKVTFGPIHAQLHPQHTWNLLCLWCLSLHHLRGVVRKKTDEIVKLIFKKNLQVILRCLLFLFHHLNNHWTWGHDTKHIWWCRKWVGCSLLIKDFVEIQ